MVKANSTAVEARKSCDADKGYDHLSRACLSLIIN